MPSYAINNLTAPDAYSQASTLWPLPVLQWVNIDVTNSAIYWSIAQANSLMGNTDAGVWQPEVFMTPGSRQLVRANMVGIRFRAAVAAASLPSGQTQAQVTVEAVQS